MGESKTKVRTVTASEAAENKRRQLILRNAGYTAVEVNGSWGPWQLKLWKTYTDKHPEVLMTAYTNNSVDVDERSDSTKPINLTKILINGKVQPEKQVSTSVSPISILPKEVQDKINLQITAKKKAERDEIIKKQKELVANGITAVGVTGNWGKWQELQYLKLQAMLKKAKEKAPTVDSGSVEQSVVDSLQKKYNEWADNKMKLYEQKQTGELRQAANDYETNLANYKKERDAYMKALNKGFVTSIDSSTGLNFGLYNSIVGYNGYNSNGTIYGNPYQTFTYNTYDTKNGWTTHTFTGNLDYDKELYNRQNGVKVTYKDSYADIKKVKKEYLDTLQKLSEQGKLTLAQRNYLSLRFDLYYNKRQSKLYQSNISKARSQGAKFVGTTIGVPLALAMAAIIAPALSTVEGAELLGAAKTVNEVVGTGVAATGAVKGTINAAKNLNNGEYLSAIKDATSALGDAASAYVGAGEAKLFKNIKSATSAFRYLKNVSEALRYINAIKSTTKATHDVVNGKYLEATIDAADGMSHIKFTATKPIVSTVKKVLQYNQYYDSVKNILAAHGSQSDVIKFLLGKGLTLKLINEMYGTDYKITQS